MNISPFSPLHDKATASYQITTKSNTSHEIFTEVHSTVVDKELKPKIHLSQQSPHLNNDHEARNFIFPSSSVTDLTQFQMSN